MLLLQQHGDVTEAAALLRRAIDLDPQALSLLSLLVQKYK